MGELEAKNGLWIDEETTFETKPDADGSGHFPLFGASQISAIENQHQVVETNWDNDDNLPTRHQMGPDGGQFSHSLSAFGLAVAAGDAEDPGTQSPEAGSDLVMKALFGRAASEVNGEGVGIGSTVNNLILDGSALALQDLACVYELGLNTPDMARWAQVAVATGAPTYNIAPAWENAPTTGAVMFGNRYWFPNDDFEGSFSFYKLEDNTPYNLLGCIPTKAILAQPNGGAARWQLTWAYSSKVRDPANFGSLPALNPSTQPEPLGLRSPIYLNGTQIDDVASISLDLGLSYAHRASRLAANGRSEGRFLSVRPVLTIDPIFKDAVEDLYDNATPGAMLLQIGGGVLSGGRVNTLCVHFHDAQVSTLRRQGRAGEKGASLQIRANTIGEYAAGVASRRVTLAIA